MKIRSRNVLLISVLVLGVPGTTIFAEEPVYGSQLMTQQERMEHRTNMQSMNTMEEREQYRIEHHKKMQVRAKQQGVTLPDALMMHKKGMGGGRGMGGGSMSMGRSVGMPGPDQETSGRLSKKEELQLLKEQAEKLKKQTEEIESRIKSLE